VKPVVEEHVALDARVLGRGGGLAPGSRYGTAWKVGERGVGIARIVVGEDVMDVMMVEGLPCSVSGTIDLDRTACRYGGSRCWLLCPGCGRRRVVLYLDQSEGFSCRGCLDLTYTSSQASRQNRDFLRMHKAAERLGVDLATGQLEVRRGLHSATRLRLTEDYEKAVMAVIGNAPPWLMSSDGAGDPRKAA
jgi:hypothetical protein